MRRICMLLIPFMCCCNWSVAQKVVIEEICVSGNTKTEEPYILSLLDVSEGDSVHVSMIPKVLEKAKLRILGTSLFNDVVTNVSDWQDKKLVLDIQVTEGWHIYPYIILELADRNFSVWWKDHNHSLDRINYGLGLYHINLSGRGDKLKMKIQQGFTHKYEATYHMPFISRGIGLFAEVFYADERETSAKTVGNKQFFVKNPEESKLYRRRRSSIGVDIRRGYKNLHELRLRYFHHDIHPYLLKSNPTFFDKRASFRHLSFEYTYIRDSRDFKFYPHEGQLIEAKLIKDGLGLLSTYANLSLEVDARYYQPLVSTLGLSVEFLGRKMLHTREVPYFFSQALGYKNRTIRGYELYVVDGSDYGLLKTALRYRILDRVIKFGKIVPIRQLRRLPLLVYVRSYVENAYVRNTSPETNTFSNTWLTGYGVGIDILFYHTIGMGIEYNSNHIGERGFYLRLFSNF